MKRAFITVGMQYGDEGKGSTVETLCHEYNADLVVRYSGACQAGHNVVLEDSRHHTFSQWGCGTFKEIPTFLGKNVIINPFNMLNEAAHLFQMGVKNPYTLLTVDPDCLVATPYHVLANRIRENCRNNKHGSCGEGVGETRSYSIKYPKDAIYFRDIYYCDIELLNKLELLRSRLLNTFTEEEKRHELFLKFLDHPSDVYKKYSCMDRIPKKKSWKEMEWKTAVFEGAQGILIDEKYGTPPYYTWSNVTTDHANEMLSEIGCEDRTTIGCIRCVTTRHGVGPLNSYSEELTKELVDPNNPTNKWQGDFRVGYFDWELFDYALKCQPVDGLSVSWLDKFPGKSLEYNDKLPTTYNYVEENKDMFLSLLYPPILVESYGPTLQDKIINV